ncbi:RNA recognition motif-containing protein [Trapelia coarctata]|nr:RNA recognition motif-containing protein [Trapelia coarctata]
MEARRKRQRTSEEGTAVIISGGDEASDVDNIPTQDLDTRHRKKPSEQSRSLFVRSLPPNATTESLTEHFSQSYPLKHATVVIDPVTKKSKGYGFVTFADAEDAQRAREQLDGSLFEGKKIKLEAAEPRHRQVENEGLNGRKKSHPSTAAAQVRAEREKQRLEGQKPPKLIVRNLPWSIKEPDQLALLFRSYGKVKHATIPKAKVGTSAGFGFVVLRGRKNAEKALAGVNGTEVDGRTLAVDWAVEKEVWETLQKGGSDETESASKLDTHGHLDESAASSVKSEDDEEEIDLDDVPPSDADHMDLSSDEDNDESDDDIKMEDSPPKIRDNSSTLFVRNLPFTCTDEILSSHFKPFGPIRYARIVLDHSAERPKGTGFVCFYNVDDATACLRGAPKTESMPAKSDKSRGTTSAKKHSLLEDTLADRFGRYTLEGRVLQVSRAVDRNEAHRLTTEGSSLRDARDKDRRRLYLLSEGTIPSDSPVYGKLSLSEAKMREDSAKQRQTLIKSNPSLHLSLTRLSIRNIPRSLTSKDLKALAREAVVGFAKDVKEGRRTLLSKEELSRGGDEMRSADKERKAKGKGIVKQAKVVYEGREGSKVSEDSGAGRSRGYGFIEYVSHRSALMGLRWLNGHSVRPVQGRETAGAGSTERAKRLIVEFAIENAQLVARRTEQEIKARERSRAVDAQGNAGETRDSRKRAKRAISRNEIMAKTRKGAKKVSSKDGKGGAAQTTTGLRSLDPEDITAMAIEPQLDKRGRRQQIIGRKRMQRKARKSS